MTTCTLLMPRLGETMEEGVIVGWLVETGAAFRRGDAMLELETDKTTVEYSALGDGVLDRPLVQAGDRVAVGAPIAEVTVKNAEEWSDASTPTGQSPVADIEPGAPAIGSSGLNTLLMPRLGETMDEGVVVRWLIAEGDAYRRGNAILEIETDKTVAEVPALSDGRLVRILAAEGVRLAVGQPIAVVDGEVDGEAAPEDLAEVVAAPPSVPVVARPVGVRPRATPLARRLARQTGVSLEALTGTGRRGRIERGDVEAGPKATPASTGAGLFAAVQGGRIAYDVDGSGAQGTFLLLHGYAGNRTTWGATASALARAGYRVVTPDLPNHGATEVDTADLDELVAALAAFADCFEGALRFVGHSMGAAAAVLLAARLGDRVSDLVLVAPAGAGREIDADFIRGMATATTPGEIAHLLPRLGPKAVALSDTAVAAMAREAARGRLVELADALVGVAGQRLDILRPLGALSATLPVRAIFGTEDRVVPATQALNLPPRVAAHFLPAGHMPQWDLPREVADLILKGDRNG